MLALLLNMSFANRIEKGQFIPELKQGDFLRPVLRFRLLSKCSSTVRHLTNTFSFRQSTNWDKSTGLNSNAYYYVLPKKGKGNTMTRKQMKLRDRITLYLTCPTCGREVQRTVWAFHYHGKWSVKYLPRGSWQCPNGCRTGETTP